ncbi:MAG: cysteine desulfurase family protein [Candidatus Pacebacteria bacterium]|nr:cysteine desulfurase family protein [Candidatus Paceibacterota bacterium]
MSILSHIFKKQSKRVYLDYASTTPLDPRVIKAMKVSGLFANPSSLYEEAVAVSKKIAEARTDIARALGGHADEIVFTSGGTESNNLALRGVVEASFEKEPFRKNQKIPHIVTSVIEHSSILETCRDLEKSGQAEVTYVPAGADGRVDPSEIKKSIRPETILISIMYVNNEIGTIQPIKEIAKIVREERKKRGEESTTTLYFHTDACQAALYCPLGVPQLGVDMLTLDASKTYGPKGSGLLFVRRGVEIKPIITGGGQERGLRSGTENLAGIIGLATALKIADAEKEKEILRVWKLRDYLLKKILEIKPKVRSNISNDHNTEIAPNFINVCFPGSDAEYLVLQLDVKGFCVSSVSSCRTVSEDSSSYVIEAVRRSDPTAVDCSKSSLRITLGRYTKKPDIEAFLKAIAQIIY